MFSLRFLSYFYLKGIPSLIIVKSDGNILSRYGCEDITRLGIEALKTWERGEKVNRSSSN